MAYADIRELKDRLQQISTQVTSIELRTHNDQKILSVQADLIVGVLTALQEFAAQSTKASEGFKDVLLQIHQELQNLTHRVDALEHGLREVPPNVILGGG
jgi:uncharacterized protein YukE